MELIISVAFHALYIFVVQSLLFVAYAAEAEKRAINNLIANGLARQITKTPEMRDLFRIVLPLVRLPQTCIGYDNRHWINFLWLFLLVSILVVTIVCLLVYIFAPEVPIAEIALWNLGIFLIVGVIEFYFFKTVVLKYSDISMRDIIETIRLALETDPTKI